MDSSAVANGLASRSVSRKEKDWKTGYNKVWGRGLCITCQRPLKSIHRGQDAERPNKHVTWPVDVSQPLSMSELAQWAHVWSSHSGRGRDYIGAQWYGLPLTKAYLATAVSESSTKH